jgi:hypothetical protein
MEQLIKLQQYLGLKFSGALLMPANETGKLPLFAHKDNKYTLNDVYTKGIPNAVHGCLILLSKELIVVDIDDKDMGDNFMKLYEFANTVITETKKGYHFYFQRTDKCDAANMFDGARQMFINPDEPYPIDIKTICKTGTSGVISIPPSKNKKWLRKLGDYDPLPMPDRFVDFYLHTKKKKHIPEKKKHISTIKDTSIMNYDNQYILKLISCLKPSRSYNYTEWINLGWCLHNISFDLMESWISFSRQSTKFNLEECQFLWTLMKNSGYYIGSLCMWAKEDNPQKYFEILNGPRLFYAKLLNTESVNSFVKCVKYIVKDVLKIKLDVNYIVDGELLKFNFGFKNRNDNFLFKYIVQYFCDIPTNGLKKIITIGFDPDIYYTIQPSFDKFEVIDNDKLEDICDRYIVKKVKLTMKLDIFYKTKIIGNHYREILYNIKFQDIITPNYSFTDYGMFLLYCIPSKDQAKCVWYTIGSILFNLDYKLEDFISWDSSKTEEATSLWPTLIKKSKYDLRFLQFIASLYIKDCKQSFEHFKMIEELYIIENDMTVFQGETEEYNIGVIDPINARCKEFDIINYDMYTSIAPLGSGKSYRCIEALKPVIDYTTSILVPTSRTSYADNITQRYNEEFDDKFICYKNVESFKEILYADRLVVQLESIIKTKKPMFDVVIIDEIESLLYQFLSETIKSRFEDCLERFLHYLCNATKIIACDAFSSNRLLNFIRFIKQNHVNKDFKIMLSINQGKTIARKAYKLGTVCGRNKENMHKSLLYYIFKKINEKKKIAIVSASKKDLDTIIANIIDKYPTLKVKSYTSDTDDTECREHFKQCNKYWFELDVVSWTSKILIGINFSIESIYDSIFVIGDNMTSLVRDIHQSIMRIRYLISDEIYYLVNEHDCDEKKDFVARDLRFFISQVITNLSYVNYSNEVKKYTNFIIYLLGYNNYEKYISRRCYTKEFDRLLLNQNYEIIDISKEDKDLTVEFIQLGDSDTIDYEKYNQFLNDNMCIIDKIETRVKTYKASVKDKAVLKVFYFNKLFKYPLNNMIDDFTNWKELFDVYDSRESTYLLNIRLECKAFFGNIEELIIHNNSNMFASINTQKLKFIMEFNKALGIKHSLDFSKKFSEKDMEDFYDKFKDKLEEIKKLFSIRCNPLYSDKYKAKFISIYLNSIYLQWSNIKFKSIEVERPKINNIRVRQYSYNFIKPEKCINNYEILVKDDILKNYLELLYKLYTGNVYLIKDD